MRPRTERNRVLEALHDARQKLAAAQAQHAQAPTPHSEKTLEKARKELEVLERRVVQVNTY